MKRDWEIIRRILIQLEDLGDTRSTLMPEDVAGYDAEAVSYHMKLMQEAGLIEGRCVDAMQGLRCWATRLTWAGHEFLDRVRDQQLWNRVKSTVREKGLELSFDVIKVAANMIIGAVFGAVEHHNG
jgi:repressor of nif and glnA expression